MVGDGHWRPCDTDRPLQHVCLCAPHRQSWRTQRHLPVNWLRVLGTAKPPQIDQGVRQQFHAKMSLLNTLKTKQQPLEFVLPRKGPVDPSSQGMNSCIE